MGAPVTPVPDLLPQLWQVLGLPGSVGNETLVVSFTASTAAKDSKAELKLVSPAV